MGFVLRLEADAIDCYLHVKDGHTEMVRRRAAGVEPGESLATSKKAWRAAAGERGCMPNDYDPSKSIGTDLKGAAKETVNCLI